MHLKKFLQLNLVFFTIWVLSTIIGQVNAASVGVSPGGIYNESLKPGSSFEQEFIISRGNPDRTVEAEIQVDAEEIRDWLTITPGIDMVLPAGEQRVSFTVAVNVPEDAEYGKYDGYLRVVLKNEDQGQVSIQPAIRLDLSFALTEKEVRLFEAQNASVQDTDEVSPLVLELKIRNNGNAGASPDFVTVDIYSLGEDLVDTFSSNEVPEIPPFKTKSVEVEFEDHKLEPGTYVGEITIKDLDEDLLVDRSIFNVYEGGVVDDVGEVSETGDENLFERIQDLLKTSLKGNLETLGLALDKYKYYLISGFLFTSFLIIFILLLVDREKEEEEK